MALGQETVYIAIETFLEVADCSNYTGAELMRAFEDYVNTLGTQPVTVTTSSLVEDMMEALANTINDVRTFSWKQNTEALVRDFIRTRDCWYQSENCAPVVEATFRAIQYRRSHELDIELHFAWQPPYVQFRDLHNVVSEGEELLLKPAAPLGIDSAVAPVTAAFFIGPTDGWMHWDQERECFRGSVPDRLASHIGAERFEAYTVPLDLTARITKRFPGNMLFERIFRVEVPLTVKRRPSRCSRSSPPSPHPRRPNPLNNPFANAPLVRAPLRRRGRERLNDQPDFAEVCKLLDQKARGRAEVSPLRLHSLSLARLHDAISIAHPPSSVTDMEVRTVQNIDISGGEADEETKTSTKRDSRCEDEHGHTTTVPGGNRSLGSPNHVPNGSTRLTLNLKEGESSRRKVTIPFRPQPKNAGLRIAPSPSPSPTVRMTKTRGEVNLGSTHINSHGKLASRSESGDGNHTSAFSTPARNMTPPLMDFMSSPSPSQKKGKQRMPNASLQDKSNSPQPRVPLAPHFDFKSLNTMPGPAEPGTSKNPAIGSDASTANGMICYTCVLRDGKRQAFPSRGSPSFCLACGNAKPQDSPVQLSSTAEKERKPSNKEEAIDQWQKRIRQNFQEFVETKGQENVEVSVEDVFDSDKEEVSEFDSIL